MACAIGYTALAIPRGRLGEQAEAHLLVLYSADRGTIVSGYQFSDMSKVAIPGDTLWLR